MTTGNTSIKLTVAQLQEITRQRFGNIEQAIMTLTARLEPMFAAHAAAAEAAILKDAPKVPSEMTEAKLAELTKPVAPAPMVAAAIADGALSSVSDLDLRKFYAACGQELKRRKHGTTGSTKTAERETAKIEYKGKKGEYESRPFGVICPSKPADKQLLRRRFNDYAEAERQAAELRASMKRDYRVIPLS